VRRVIQLVRLVRPVRPVRLVLAALALTFAALPAAAQSSLLQAPAPATPQPSESGWSASAELALYVLPDEANYLWPTVSADHDWLHLEARYNYEAKNTASFWAGVNFEWGERVSLAVTPMFGVVTGDTDGVAPGFLFTLGAGKFELYSEGELMLDSGGKEDSFYYSWTELSFTPVSWLSLGAAAQKTRAYQTARYIERGVLAGTAWKNMSLTGYVFEPFSDKPTVVVAFGIEF
jgi:hypothetical protein